MDTTNPYSRVPNITVVSNKSVGGIFNKTVGDLLKKIFQIRTCRREKQPKKNKMVIFFMFKNLQF